MTFIVDIRIKNNIQLLHNREHPIMRLIESTRSYNTDNNRVAVGFI